ncbi:hypothetical protein D9M69_617080 [compost metagenome]
MSSEPAPRINRLPSGTTRVSGGALRVRIGAMMDEPRLTPSTMTTASSGVISPRDAKVVSRMTPAMLE